MNFDHSSYLINSLNCLSLTSEDLFDIEFNLLEYDSFLNSIIKQIEGEQYYESSNDLCYFQYDQQRDSTESVTFVSSVGPIDENTRAKLNEMANSLKFSKTRLMDEINNSQPVSDDYLKKLIDLHEGVSQTISKIDLAENLLYPTDKPINVSENNSEQPFPFYTYIHKINRARTREEVSHAIDEFYKIGNFGGEINHEIVTKYLRTGIFSILTKTLQRCYNWPDIELRIYQIISILVPLEKNPDALIKNSNTIINSLYTLHLRTQSNFNRVNSTPSIQNLTDSMEKLDDISSSSVSSSIKEFSPDEVQFSISSAVVELAFALTKSWSLGEDFHLDPEGQHFNLKSQSNRKHQNNPSSSSIHNSLMEEEKYSENILASIINLISALNETSLSHFHSTDYFLNLKKNNHKSDPLSPGAFRERTYSIDSSQPPIPQLMYSTSSHRDNSSHPFFTNNQSNLNFSDTKNFISMAFDIDIEEMLTEYDKPINFNKFNIHPNTSTQGVSKPQNLIYLYKSIVQCSYTLLLVSQVSSCRRLIIDYEGLPLLYSWLELSIYHLLHMNIICEEAKKRRIYEFSTTKSKLDVNTDHDLDLDLDLNTNIFSSNFKSVFDHPTFAENFMGLFSLCFELIEYTTATLMLLVGGHDENYSNIDQRNSNNRPSTPTTPSIKDDFKSRKQKRGSKHNDSKQNSQKQKKGKKIMPHLITLENIDLYLLELTQILIQSANISFSNFIPHTKQRFKFLEKMDSEKLNNLDRSSSIFTDQEDIVHPPHFSLLPLSSMMHLSSMINRLGSGVRGTKRIAFKNRIGSILSPILASTLSILENVRDKKQIDDLEQTKDNSERFDLSKPPGSIDKDKSSNQLNYGYPLLISKIFEFNPSSKSFNNDLDISSFYNSPQQLDFNFESTCQTSLNNFNNSISHFNNTLNLSQSVLSSNTFKNKNILTYDEHNEVLNSKVQSTNSRPKSLKNFNQNFFHDSSIENYFGHFPMCNFILTSSLSTFTKFIQEEVSSFKSSHHSNTNLHIPHQSRSSTSSSINNSTSSISSTSPPLDSLSYGLYSHPSFLPHLKFILAFLPPSTGREAALSLVSNLCLWGEDILLLLEKEQILDTILLLTSELQFNLKKQNNQITSVSNSQVQLVRNTEGVSSYLPNFLKPTQMERNVSNNSSISLASSLSNRSSQVYPHLSFFSTHSNVNIPSPTNESAYEDNHYEQYADIEANISNITPSSFNPLSPILFINRPIIETYHCVKFLSQFCIKTASGAHKMLNKGLFTIMKELLVLVYCQFVKDSNSITDDEADEILGFILICIQSMCKVIDSEITMNSDNLFSCPSDEDDSDGFSKASLRPPSISNLPHFQDWMALIVSLNLILKKIIGNNNEYDSPSHITSSSISKLLLRVIETIAQIVKMHPSLQDLVVYGSFIGQKQSNSSPTCSCQGSSNSYDCEYCLLCAQSNYYDPREEDSGCKYCCCCGGVSHTVNTNTRVPKCSCSLDKNRVFSSAGCLRILISILVNPNIHRKVRNAVEDVLRNVGFSGGMKDFEICFFDFELLKSWYNCQRSLPIHQVVYSISREWTRRLFEIDYDGNDNLIFGPKEVNNFYNKYIHREGLLHNNRQLSKLDHNSLFPISSNQNRFIYQNYYYKHHSFEFYHNLLHNFNDHVFHYYNYFPVYSTGPFTIVSHIHSKFLINFSEQHKYIPDFNFNKSILNESIIGLSSHNIPPPPLFYFLYGSLYSITGDGEISIEDPSELVNRIASIHNLTLVPSTSPSLTSFSVLSKVTASVATATNSISLGTSSNSGTSNSISSSSSTPSQRKTNITDSILKFWPFRNNKSNSSNSSNNSKQNFFFNSSKNIKPTPPNPTPSPNISKSNSNASLSSVSSIVDAGRLSNQNNSSTPSPISSNPPSPTSPCKVHSCISLSKSSIEKPPASVTQVHEIFFTSKLIRLLTLDLLCLGACIPVYDSSNIKTFTTKKRTDSIDKKIKRTSIKHNLSSESLNRESYSRNEDDNSLGSSYGDYDYNLDDESFEDFDSEENITEECHEYDSIENDPIIDHLTDTSDDFDYRFLIPNPLPINPLLMPSRIYHSFTRVGRVIKAMIDRSIQEYYNNYYYRLSLYIENYENNRSKNPNRKSEDLYEQFFEDIYNSRLAYSLISPNSNTSEESKIFHTYYKDHKSSFSPFLFNNSRLRQQHQYSLSSFASNPYTSPFLCNNVFPPLPPPPLWCLAFRDCEFDGEFHSSLISTLQQNPSIVALSFINEDTSKIDHGAKLGNLIGQIPPSINFVNLKGILSSQSIQAMCLLLASQNAAFHPSNTNRTSNHFSHTHEWNYSRNSHNFSNKSNPYIPNDYMDEDLHNTTSPSVPPSSRGLVALAITHITLDQHDVNNVVQLLDLSNTTSHRYSHSSSSFDMFNVKTMHKSYGLRNLDLSSTNLNDNNATLILKASLKGPLEGLELSSNSIKHGTQFLKLISSVFPDSKNNHEPSNLRYLGLSNNKLTSSMIVNLLTYLTNNSSLTHLDISHNYLESNNNVNEALTKFLTTNVGLRVLNLSNNRFSIETLKAIIKGIENNSSILLMQLDGNLFSEPKENVFNRNSSSNPTSHHSSPSLSPYSSGYSYFESDDSCECLHYIHKKLRMNREIYRMQSSRGFTKGDNFFPIDDGAIFNNSIKLSKLDEIVQDSKVEINSEPIIYESNENHTASTTMLSKYAENKNMFEQNLVQHKKNIPTRDRSKSATVYYYSPDEKSSVIKNHSGQIVNLSFKKSLNNELTNKLMKISSEKSSKDILEPISETLNTDISKGTSNSIYESSTVPLIPVDLDKVASLHVLFSQPLVGFDRYHQAHPLPSLEHEEERKLLYQVFKEAKRDVHLSLGFATTDVLRTLLTLGGCKALHFSGHGLPKGLCFEDGRAGLQLLTATQLAGLLRAGENEMNSSIQDLKNTSGLNSTPISLEFVFVSACHSRPIGECFISAGVRHVVCVKVDSKIQDTAAHAFTRAFYVALLSGKTVKASFSIAKTALKLSPYVPNSVTEGDKFVLLPEEDEEELDKANRSENDQNSLIQSKPKKSIHDRAIFVNRKVVDWPLPNHCTMGSNRIEMNTMLERYRLPTNNNNGELEGREVAMNTIIRSLLERKLVSVLGPDGIGKSSVSVAVCRYMAEREMIKDAVIYYKGKTVKDFQTFILSLKKAILSSGENAASQRMRKLISERNNSNNNQSQSPFFFNNNSNSHFINIQESDITMEEDLIFSCLEPLNTLLVLDHMEDLFVDHSSNNITDIRLFLGRLFEQCPHQKILYVSIDALSTHNIQVEGIIEYSIVLKNLSLYYALRLFAKMAPPLTTSNQKLEFVEALLPPKQFQNDENLSSKILNLIGDGHPSKIVHMACMINAEGLDAIKQKAHSIFQTYTPSVSTSPSVSQSNFLSLSSSRNALAPPTSSNLKTPLQLQHQHLLNQQNQLNQKQFLYNPNSSNNLSFASVLKSSTSLSNQQSLSQPLSTSSFSSSISSISTSSSVIQNSNDAPNSSESVQI